MCDRNGGMGSLLGGCNRDEMGDPELTYGNLNKGGSQLYYRNSIQNIGGGELPSPPPLQYPPIAAGKKAIEKREIKRTRDRPSSL